MAHTPEGYVPPEPESRDERLWIIHGKRYDLTDFAAVHPGGAVAINMARGRDCTELFESYHALSDKPRAMMHKFLATDQSNVPSPLFNWKDTPFYDELKHEVRAYFKKNGMSHKDTWFGLSRHAFFVLLTLVSLWYWSAGHWWTLAVLPWAYWLGPSHMMHSGSHGAISKYEAVNVICAYFGSAHVSIYDWMHQHVIGHHAHVNIVNRDPDLEHFAHIDQAGPGFRLSAHQAWLNKYLNWRLAMPMQAFFTTLGPAFVNQFHYWSKMAFFNVPYLNVSRTRFVLHVLGRIAIVAFMVLVPVIYLPWYKVLPFALLPLGFHGYIYYCFSQISHATGAANHHGDERECVQREWAVHQVLHSLDYSAQSLVWRTLSIGLNCQALHHVFPSIATTHYGPLSLILERVAEKHNVKYNRVSSFREALVEHYRHVRGLNNQRPEPVPGVWQEPPLPEDEDETLSQLTPATRAFLRRIAVLVLYVPPLALFMPLVWQEALRTFVVEHLSGGKVKLPPQRPATPSTMTEKPKALPDHVKAD